VFRVFQAAIKSSGNDKEMTFELTNIPDGVLVAVAEWFRRRTHGPGKMTPWEKMMPAAKRQWLNDAEEVIHLAEITWGEIPDEFLGKDRWKKFRRKWERIGEEDDPGVSRGMMLIMDEVERLQFGEVWSQGRTTCDCQGQSGKCPFASLRCPFSNCCTLALTTFRSKNRRSEE